MAADLVGAGLAEGAGFLADLTRGADLAVEADDLAAAGFLATFDAVAAAAGRLDGAACLVGLRTAGAFACRAFALLFFLCAMYIISLVRAIRQPRRRRGLRARHR